MFSIGNALRETTVLGAPELMSNYHPGDSWRWVPISTGVDFYPFCFDITHSAWHIILRVQPGMRLPAHYHTSRVIVCTLRGAWRYVERDWVHSPGSYLLEAPGDIHTFECVSDAEPAELFVVNEGANLSFDSQGVVCGYTDVLVRLRQAREHYRNCGQPDSLIEGLIR